MRGAELRNRGKCTGDCSILHLPVLRMPGYNLADDDYREDVKDPDSEQRCAVDHFH